MINQVEVSLKARSRGFHLITAEILLHLPELPEKGIVHIFCKHTSAGICINENADPDVLHDYAHIFDNLIPENIPGIKHTIEGPDDMPAHIKTTLSGTELSIPITNHRLNLGTWQGIYLCEFRNQGGSRKIVVTIWS